MSNEEYVEIMDNSNFMIDSANPYDMKIKEALEKQIPKKPIDVQKPVVRWGICPTCKGLPEELGRPQRVFQSNNYCSNCGQKIDWGMRMTEQIKKAIEIEKEKANNDYEMASSFHDDNGVYLKYETQYRERAEYEERLAEWLEDYLYIKSAWSEVLQKLELLIKGCDRVIGDVENTEFYVGKKNGYLKAIDIINKHLAEIEETR